MPLLNDAKACFVGNQPITTIMAGSVQVWPKGPPPPFRALRLFFTAPSDPSINQGFYIAWKVPIRPSNCSRATAYEYRHTETGSAYPDDKWLPWLTFGYRTCVSWMPRTAEFENNLVTFLATAGGKEYVKIQLRYTDSGVVTTSEEYEFSIVNPLINLPPLPSFAMNYPCPETCP